MCNFVIFRAPFHLLNRRITPLHSVYWAVQARHVVSERKKAMCLWAAGRYLGHLLETKLMILTFISLQIHKF